MLLNKHKHITCVSFMGGDADHADIAKLARRVKEIKDIKVAMYSGNTEIDPQLVEVLDYYKVGPWIASFGPLNSKTTNQKLYKIVDGELEDITFKFLKK